MSLPRRIKYGVNSCGNPIVNLMKRRGNSSLPASWMKPPISWKGRATPPSPTGGSSPWKARWILISSCRRCSQRLTAIPSTNAYSRKTTLPSNDGFATAGTTGRRSTRMMCFRKLWPPARAQGKDGVTWFRELYDSNIIDVTRHTPLKISSSENRKRLFSCLSQPHPIRRKGAARSHQAIHTVLRGNVLSPRAGGSYSRF